MIEQTGLGKEQDPAADQEKRMESREVKECKEKLVRRMKERIRREKVNPNTEFCLLLVARLQPPRFLPGQGDKVRPYEDPMARIVSAPRWERAPNHGTASRSPHLGSRNPGRGDISNRRIGLIRGGLRPGV